MRLLFLLVFAPLCVAFCPAGHYKDDAFQKCMKCTPCHIVQVPCSQFKDAVCAPIKSSEPQHLKKKLIHFFDDTEDDSDEDYHSRNIVGGFYDDLYDSREKSHHKKGSKHYKFKPNEKHHHKKNHFEFDADEDRDSLRDNLRASLDEGFKIVDSQKTKLHNAYKKHYELKKKQIKKELGDILESDQEFEDEKLHYLLSKQGSKKKKDLSHHKKITDEETLEELLKQSQRKLKQRKDNFLKTLKEEEEGSTKHIKTNKKVHLNSPVFDVAYDDLEESQGTLSPESSLKALAHLKEDLKKDDDKFELNSLLSDDEDITVSIPLRKKIPGEGTPGQIKTPEETIRDELGKPFVYEKPRINVIPLVVEKDPKAKKILSRNVYPEHVNPKFNVLPTRAPWNDDVISQPFTAAETLVWDWQAIAVASAVASCLVFFLVVAIYFAINARQWKTVSKKHSTGFEEMSTRIALMQPTMESGCQDCTMTQPTMESACHDCTTTLADLRKILSAEEEDKKCDQKV